MSNTVKIGTIFLACLLNLFQAAALKESIPSTNPRLEKIKWDHYCPKKLPHRFS